MKRIITATIGVSVALVLAGCSAASTVVVTATPTPTSAASSASTTTATPTPSPTVMSKAQAADWYLGTVCPANAADDAANATIYRKYADELDKAKVRRLSNQAANANRAAAERFDAPPLPWPADVRDAIKKLTASTLATVTYYQAVAQAKTADDMITASNSNVGSNPSNVPAQTARLRLGLPVAGGARDGCAKWLAAHR